MAVLSLFAPSVAVVVGSVVSLPVVLAGEVVAVGVAEGLQEAVAALVHARLHAFASLPGLPTRAGLSPALLVPKPSVAAACLHSPASALAFALASAALASAALASAALASVALASAALASAALASASAPASASSLVPAAPVTVLRPFAPAAGEVWLSCWCHFHPSRPEHLGSGAAVFEACEVAYEVCEVVSGAWQRWLTHCSAQTTATQLPPLPP